MVDIESKPGSGVQLLIDRLRDQGVAAGRAEAERIVEEARREAQATTGQARAEAARLLTEARAEADRYKAAGEEAVRLAVRDAVLHMREALTKQFADQVRRLVTREMKDPELLRRLIVAVAGRAARDQVGDAPIDVLLSADAIEIGELRRHQEEIKQGNLSHLVLEIAREMLRDGIEFKVAGDTAPGLRLKLRDRDVEIDLTDEAVSGYLLRHLLPRFRVLFEGVVQ